LTLAGGQPLLEALFLRMRTPALAAAVQALADQDAALFGEALAVLDQAHDLEGLIWLWHNAGRDSFQHFTTLIERAVQPAWYPALMREAELWRALLAAGRALALAQTGSEDAAISPGVLLRALPQSLVPFVWQACLATAGRHAGFAEWWLFNEALALPDQLPELWKALQRLPAGSLREAGPALNYLLGRQADGLSLLRACTPPGQAEPNEALYAVVLRAWLEAGFRSPAGNLVLAAEDIAFLISVLPGSNDILAAIAASPIQRPAIQRLAASQALAWAQAADGERRQPYRADGQDRLFRRLIDLPGADEALYWHLLVEDEGSRFDEMPWAKYAALAVQVRARLNGQGGDSASPLQAYLAAATALQNPEVAEAFAQNRIDLRRVLALLATYAEAPEQALDLLDSLLPLAVFHLQETGGSLKDRSAALLRASLQRPEVTAQLQGLPESVLAYLRQFCTGLPALEATGHWIEAELSRRANAYRLETNPKPIRPNSTAPVVMPTKPLPTPDPLPQAPAPAELPAMARRPAARPEPPPPPPPGPQVVDTAVDQEAAPLPLLGQLALPVAAPRKRDSAIFLWVMLIVIVLLAIAVVVGVFIYVRSLGAAAGWPSWMI
jgi:hypothetical protein